tara:strand:- start:144 stop:359 length:216 start_codon:yes stop_codon:yes gene_type:complete
MNYYKIFPDQLWSLIFLCIVILSLVACGVKSSPSEFKNQIINDDIETPKKIIKQRSPLGFPLEYPNRPSYK